MEMKLHANNKMQMFHYCYWY